MLYNRIIQFCFFSLLSLQSFAQQDSLSYNFGDFGGIVYLDSLTVTATREGFQVNDFVEMVQEDESFYEAFKNIRVLSYEAINEMKMFDKKGNQKADYFSRTHQKSDGNCRTMDIIEERHSGNFFKKNKKRKYKYYTAKMFDRLFFTSGKVCESDQANGTSSPKGMEKHVAELKKLIFKPGQKANVPVIGKKTAIFSEEMIKYYDFFIESQLFNGSIKSYSFSVKVKPEYIRKKDKTVIKYLKTYFDKENFQVLGREYQLAYSAALFEFDITMQIKLLKKGNEYYPERIKYDGFWDIPARKPEISKFSSAFSSYERP